MTSRQTSPATARGIFFANWNGMAYGTSRPPREDWLFNDIRKLDREWSDVAGVLLPKTQEAQVVPNKFVGLIGLAKHEILALND